MTVLQGQTMTATTDTGLPPAIVHGWFFVPYSALGDEDGIKAEKQRLTFVPKFADENDPPVRLYRDLPSKGYLGVPRAYGLHRFPWLAQDDRTTDGVPFLGPIPRLPDPNHPAVKEPERQAAFMQDMLATAQTQKSFVAQASTGSGKTCVALWTAAQLGRKTLILVHLERLQQQWLEEIRDKLGLPDERIGIVQGPTCQWEDRDFVVGMMPSLSQRNTYPRDFYQSFGTVIVDECHRVGSPMLSRCASLFPAKVRIGLSATPHRKDGGDRILFWHLGPIAVKSSARALECTVYVKRYRTARRLWGKNHQSRAKCLSQDPDRNAMLVDLIERNWRVGRNILVIGKFVAHLQDLMDECARRGIPVDQMAQYTGEKLIRQRASTGKMVVVRKVKVTKAEYDRAKREAKVIFATYGVFKEGIDIPRLDCGIDVLPQSEATQVIGRIRRPMEGKPKPYWITILDEACSLSRRMFDKRMQDYTSTGCRIVDNNKL